MTFDPNRKAYNSTLRPVALRKAASPKQKKPSLKDVKRKFGIVTAAMLGEKKKRKPMPTRTGTKHKGWWNVALEIWAEREHRCAVTGVSLGDVPQPSFFSHLLPRFTYPDFKRDKRNIVLKSPSMHAIWHKYGPEVLKAYPEWRKTCDLYFKLRDEANGVVQ